MIAKDSNKFRFIEAKGRIKGAETVTISKNEVLTVLYKPDEFILALVEIDEDKADVSSLQHPFQKEPDFHVTRVNYNFAKLWEKGSKP